MRESICTVRFKQGILKTDFEKKVVRLKKQQQNKSGFFRYYGNFGKNLKIIKIYYNVKLFALGGVKNIDS